MGAHIQTRGVRHAYWGKLHMDEVDILYEEMMRADANVKQDDGAVLDALA
ncbi:hypothetical protein SPRG_05564 [Saprolegnia parasitica CBS 223.65]|uniref:Uncharacterized protein n=1 Tax=Saprolegnia parasitica (strain CBS 223.65) TaxID=695850 RepID=A0A067CSW3_SAPPC|nr:hypothetical protein SPRG_05564 [Saprolegnia parasitica CBS 223.65]KDO29611.1 hypothetical protein SPRG_05564 [Saprolegnia parasitica CBS 223.65]|eukprot:XP_012199671.1 hypothetical protein SPRG_05564 [Saprolegnia parasitica CBS 223.65]